MTFQKDGRFSWLYLAVTCIVMFTVMGLNDSGGVFLAIFIEHFNETNAKAGWVVSLIVFILLAITPLVIYIHGRFGFRWCMAISSFCYGIAFVITPLMPSLNFVFVSYSIPFGICSGFLALLSVVTQRQYFDKHYGFAVGVRFASNALGSIVFSFVLPIIYDDIGFKGMFFSLVAFTPLFLCYGLLSRPPIVDRDTEFSRSNRNTGNVYWELLQDRSFVLCLAGTGIYFFTALIPLFFMTLSKWLKFAKWKDWQQKSEEVQYGVTLGHPLSQAKWLLIARSMATLPARLIAGRVGDIALKHGKVKLLVEIVYFIFGLLSLLCSFVHSFSLLILYMVLVGVVEGVMWVSLPLYLVEITAGYHSDEALSLVCFAASFTTLVGPPTVGLLLDQTGSFRYGFYIIFVVSSLSAFLLTISSFVTVQEQVSLVEKGRSRKRKNVELMGKVEESDVDEMVSGTVFVYETTV